VGIVDIPPPPITITDTRDIPGGVVDGTGYVNEIRVLQNLGNVISLFREYRTFESQLTALWWFCQKHK
jgi:hypothetical protein